MLPREDFQILLNLYASRLEVSKFIAQLCLMPGIRASYWRSLSMPMNHFGTLIIRHSRGFEITISFYFISRKAIRTPLSVRLAYPVRFYG